MIHLALVLPAAAASAQTAPEWEPHEVEGFVDGLMAGQRNAHHFAGAMEFAGREFLTVTW